MKRLIVLFFSLGILSSCSKDGNESDITNASIEGKWTLEKTSFSSDGGKTFIDELATNTAGCDKNYIEFASKGVFYRVFYGDKCILDKTTGTWEKYLDNVLLMKTGESIDEVDIISLTNTTLKINDPNIHSMEVVKTFKRI
jgi:hypothetical protein